MVKVVLARQGELLGQVPWTACLAWLDTQMLAARPQIHLMLRY